MAALKKTKALHEAQMAELRAEVEAALQARFTIVLEHSCKNILSFRHGSSIHEKSCRPKGTGAEGALLLQL
jgi:hypothetical protein